MSSSTDVSATPATARSVTVPGLVLAGTVTVIAAEPPCPSLVAVIVAVPAATPVTRPPVDTAATAGALDAQVTDRPDSGVPVASRGVAVTWSGWPTSMPAETGLTVTDATGTAATLT